MLLTIYYIYIHNIIYDLQNKDQQIIIISRSLTHSNDLLEERCKLFTIYIFSNIDKNIALDSRGM